VLGQFTGVIALNDKRIAIAQAEREFAGRYVIFTDIERGDSDEAVKGTVTGIFDSYPELFAECKSLKCEIEVGLFGPERAVSMVSTSGSGWKQTAKNMLGRFGIDVVHSHLLHGCHDDVNVNWADHVGSAGQFPLVSESFCFLWMKDWLQHGGYTAETIDQSFLYKYAWLHRNTLHGVVKADKLGILDYGRKYISLYEYLEAGGSYEPLKLHKHSVVDYEILDGHHRAAFLVLSGHTRIHAYVDDDHTAHELPELVELKKRVVEKGLPYYDLGVDGPKAKGIIKVDSWRRFESILNNISLVDCSTLLDVGCHIGFFTVLFSCYGLRCKGINPSARELEIASSYSKIIGGNATFEQTNLGDLLESDSNEYDVTVFLNVFYSVMQAAGKDEAIEMLRGLLAKTRKCLFFSTSMPGDTGAKQWQEYAMNHEEIIGLLAQHGDVSVVGQDRDYKRNIYKVTMNK
jgi:hypothetical protein